MDNCAECAREYAQQLCIFDAMQADDSIAFASEAAFQKLAARLDTSAARARPQPTARWLAAASVMPALGLAAWGGWTLAAHNGQRDRCTLPHTHCAGAACRWRAQLRVVFHPKSHAERA